MGTPFATENESELKAHFVKEKRKKERKKERRRIVSRFEAMHEVEKERKKVEAVVVVVEKRLSGKRFIRCHLDDLKWQKCSLVLGSLSS